MNEIEKLIKLDYKVCISCCILGITLQILYAIFFHIIIFDAENILVCVVGILAGIAIYSALIDLRLKKIRVEQISRDANE